uniref:Uncharacterized protein n=1 Tax=Crocodylus porosus TaxID=8502 RepID=A0A7M4DWX7_CROPO
PPPARRPGAAPTRPRPPAARLTAPAPLPAPWRQCPVFLLYREEFELERLRWRLRPGDLDLDRLTYLLLMRGGDRRHIGGGGSILLGGLKRLGGGLGRGANTAVAVISWPSIFWYLPPSMCFSAFSASSGFSNST